MQLDQLKRREFITLLGSAAAAWPLVAGAQQPDRVRRIGVVSPNSSLLVTTFQQSIEKLGWTVGRNVEIDYRWLADDVESTRAAVSELQKNAPDVILANATLALRASQQATRTIPIVFVYVSEPVAQGFVQSLAHPGGNISGFSNLEPTFGGKWVELLKRIAPRVTRLAVLFNPDISHEAVLFSRSIEAAARKFAVDAVVIQVHEVTEIEPAIATFAREPGGGLIFPPDNFTRSNRKLVVELAARYGLPAVYPFRYYTDDGGLISYGADGGDQYRRAASYVDRILRGEKPADLPVQQPTKFQLVLNLKTANALGLTIPLSILAAADEVIE